MSADSLHLCHLSRHIVRVLAPLCREFYSNIRKATSNTSQEAESRRLGSDSDSSIIKDFGDCVIVAGCLSSLPLLQSRQGLVNG